MNHAGLSKINCIMIDGISKSYRVLVVIGLLPTMFYIHCQYPSACGDCSWCVDAKINIERLP
jgi:hypothetical protein